MARQHSRCRTMSARLPWHLRAVRVFSGGRLFERSLHPQVTQYILSRQEEDPVLTKLLQTWGGDDSSTVCDGCSQQLDSGSWWKCKQCATSISAKNATRLSLTEDSIIHQATASQMGSEWRISPEKVTEKVIWAMSNQRRDAFYLTSEQIGPTSNHQGNSSSF